MNWSDWLAQLTQTQRSGLESALHLQKSDEVRVVRPNTEDYIFDKSPPYVDVFRLVPLYQKLIFKKNLLIKGPKGDGKSLSIVAFSAATRTPLITQPCSEATKSKDLIGTFFIKGTETPFVLGSMASAIDIANEYGRAIIAFEEVNALTPQTQKQLNEFLDFRRAISVPQLGKTYRLREGAQLWAVAMMNPSVYGGTYELNEDFRSRWVEVEIGYPSMDQEKAILEANVAIPPNMPSSEFHDILVRCTNLAAQTRDHRAAGSFSYALSTRDLVSFVETVMLLGIEEALQLLYHKFEGKDNELIATRISSTFLGSPKVKEKWNSSRPAI